MVATATREQVRRGIAARKERLLSDAALASARARDHADRAARHQGAVLDAAPDVPVDTPDVIVVGGGVIGLAAAYRMADSGAKTVIIDKDEYDVFGDGSVMIVSSSRMT